MERNILMENSLTIIRLKAILFDIVSEGMEVENNKSDIVANIFTKSKDLLQEINKLKHFLLKL